MRIKTLDSIEKEIIATQTSLEKTKKRYEFLSNHLENLYEKKQEVQSKSIYQKFLDSGKTYNELIKFLTPCN